MKTCPKCGAQNQMAAKFCVTCGTDLTTIASAPVTPGLSYTGTPRITCLRCRASTPATVPFCSKCFQLLPLSQGATLGDGRWVIERVLGQGGMGRAYLATDSLTKTPAVVKELLDEQGRPQEERQLYADHFTNEAYVLGLLRVIRAVPRLIQPDTTDGQRQYFVMEYIDGIDLGELVKKQGGQPLPLEQAIEYALQVGEVLEVLHRRVPPIIHRDVKPDNIRLRNSDGSVALLDFGIARDVRTGTRVTKLGGTQGFAPPEFVRGRAEPRSDLYSLSATLYFMLAGRVPEDGPDDPMNSYRQPGALIRINPKVTPDLEEVILANLTDNPQDRYVSVTDWAADLRQRRRAQTITCPNCRTVNDRRRVYCLSCGVPLDTQSRQCANCRHFIPARARFCPVCGNKQG